MLVLILFSPSLDHVRHIYRIGCDRLATVVYLFQPKNMIIMPGYCVAGTVGAKVIGGMKQIEMDGRMVSKQWNLCVLETHE